MEGFLGIGFSKIEDIDRKIAIIGIPHEGKDLFRKGTAQAPSAIRKASLMYAYKGFEGLYDPDGERIILSGRKIVDIGDVQGNGKLVKRSIAEVLEKKSIPVSVGGDHSITYPVLCAYDDEVNIIHFDSHSDLMMYGAGGATPSGTVMRRAMELPYVKSIIHIGIRGFLNSTEALRETRSKGNKVITASELKREGIPCLEKCLDKNARYYITIDSDFFDASYFPGTTVPEFKGPSFELALETIKFVATNYSIYGADFVEMNPMYDQSGISAICSAKIITELLGGIERKCTE